MLRRAGATSPTSTALMRHDIAMQEMFWGAYFAARPVYRFDENAIEVVFRHSKMVTGTFVLQTARDLHRGVTSFMASSDVRAALLAELRNPSSSPASRRWRYWRYWRYLAR